MNDLLDYILHAYQSNHARMSAINAARIMMKDYIEGEELVSAVLYFNVHLAGG
jgi:hypothetical protein